MIARSFTSPVHAFVLLINTWNTKVTVFNTQNPYLMNIKYLTLKTFIFNHMLFEIFKILKYSIPCSLKQLFNLK